MLKHLCGTLLLFWMHGTFCLRVTDLRMPSFTELCIAVQRLNEQNRLSDVYGKREGSFFYANAVPEGNSRTIRSLIRKVWNFLPQMIFFWVGVSLDISREYANLVLSKKKEPFSRQKWHQGKKPGDGNRSKCIRCAAVTNGLQMGSTCRGYFKGVCQNEELYQTSVSFRRPSGCLTTVSYSGGSRIVANLWISIGRYDYNVTTPCISDCE